MGIGGLLNRIINSVLPSTVVAGLSNTENSVILESTSDGLTAVAGGTQNNSLLLVSKFNKVTTVATNNDGVRLPPAIAGLAIKVRNDSAQTLGVFPSSATQGGVAGGDKINALAQNALFSQAATNSTTYTCYTTGTWVTN